MKNKREKMNLALKKVTVCNLDRRMMETARGGQASYQDSKCCTFDCPTT